MEVRRACARTRYDLSKFKCCVSNMNAKLFSVFLSSFGRGRTRTTSFPNQSRVPLGVLSCIGRDEAMLSSVKFLRNWGIWERDVAEIRQLNLLGWPATDGTYSLQCLPRMMIMRSLLTANMKHEDRRPVVSHVQSVDVLAVWWKR
jgi:hypothetical protein